jgi:WD40 repeat protein
MGSKESQLSILKLKTAYEIVFSPKEDRAAFIGGRDVSMVDIESGRILFAVHPAANPSHLDFSPDGRWLVVKSTSGRTRVLSAQNGEVVCDFKNQSEGEGGAAFFSPCSRYVVSVSWNGLLTVRESKSGNLVFSKLFDRCMLNHLSTVMDRSCFAFSCAARPQANHLPAPDNSIIVAEWPFDKGTLSIIPQKWPCVGGLQLAPTGEQIALVFGAPPSEMIVADIQTGIVKAQLPYACGGTGIWLAWSQDEQSLAVNGNHACMIYSWPSLEKAYAFPIAYPCFIRFSPSKRYLAVGSWQRSYIVPTVELSTFIKAQESKASRESKQRARSRERILPAT